MTTEARTQSAQTPRLSPASLPAVAPGVRRPAYDRQATRVGVVHFGPGAFHRAHQACFIDDLLGFDPRWAISAVSLRSPGVRDALEPQDGLYAVAVLDRTPSWRVVGAIREVLVAAEAPEKVFARLVSPEVGIVTLTVTEKGYCLDGGGTLNFTHPDIVHDRAAPAVPSSVIGWLAEALIRRRALGLKPFTTISCDNLPDNGRKLKAAVVALTRVRDPAAADWIAAEARFPRSMVDSITPATDDALRARAAEALGLVDAWPIQREAFLQWVIEDDLGAGGPDWPRAGVDLTDDVAGWDRAKLRLLNGAHSTLAYVGLAAGHETVAKTMDDPALAGFVRAMMIEDIAPTLTAPRGLDLGAYIEAVLGRFRNPAIRHLLAQIAWDGSQKLPVRILGTARDRLAAGASVRRLALPIAAWMRFIRRRALAGVAPVDPMADELMRVGRACRDESGPDIDLFLAIAPVFGDLTRDDRFREALRAAYDGVRALEGGALDAALLG